MILEEISEGANPLENEDLVFVHRHCPTLCDIVIMDGASSVADSRYLSSDVSDPAWFVTFFASTLRRTISVDMSPEEIISQVLFSLKKEFDVLTFGKEIPLYAYPLAAMTWVRLSELSDKVSAYIYALGDCKVLLSEPDGQVRDLDPYHNPEEDRLKAEIENLGQAWVIDESERRKILLPMIRERRIHLNSALNPTVLCVNPRGGFNARTYSYQISKDAKVFAMTDGFYRLVDTYRIFSNRDLVRECEVHGLKNILRLLRSYEKPAKDSGSRSVKRADDASALICSFQR